MSGCTMLRKGVVSLFNLEKEKNVDFLILHGDLKNEQQRDRYSWEKDDQEEARTGTGQEQPEQPLYPNTQAWVEEKVPDVKGLKKIRLRVRYDYRGTTARGRFFFGKKTTEEVAEEIREQKMMLWQSIPMQGIQVEDIKVLDIYTFIEYHDGVDEEVSYAPIEITITADSLEDCIHVISREEFRRVAILEPTSMQLDARDIEKLFFKFSQYIKAVHEEYR